ncbi:MAG TPA: formate dehydrogenase accessory sulfurtransferase FdhD, partial [Polyangiales bacterium]
MGVPERDARHSALREVASVAVVGQSVVNATQTVIVEQPLTITISGDTVATTMRTPGDDRFLALGFLFAEGVFSSIDDIGAVFHCGRTDRPDYGDTLEVVAAPGARLALERAQRIHSGTSACGLCGRERIEELLAMLPPARDTRVVPATLLARVPALLT